MAKLDSKAREKKSVSLVIEDSWVKEGAAHLSWGEVKQKSTKHLESSLDFTTVLQLRWLEFWASWRDAAHAASDLDLKTKQRVAEKSNIWCLAWSLRRRSRTTYMAFFLVLGVNLGRKSQRIPRSFMDFEKVAPEPHTRLRKHNLILKYSRLTVDSDQKTRTLTYRLQGFTDREASAFRVTSDFWSVEVCIWQTEESQYIIAGGKFLKFSRLSVDRILYVGFRT